MWKQITSDLSAAQPTKPSLGWSLPRWPCRALCVVLMTGLTGCAGNPVNLERNGMLVVEKFSSTSGHVWLAKVQAHMRSTWVSGEVIQHLTSPVDRPGHIDIEIVTPHGTTTYADAVLTPVNTAGGNSRRFAFTAPILQQLTSGSTVRVIHNPEDINHGIPCTTSA